MRQASAYLGSLNTFKQYIDSGKDNLVIIFEKLLDPATRVDELVKALDFLGTGWTREDAEHAFESPTTRKSLRPKESGQMSLAATIGDAYPVTLACEMWRKWLHYSSRIGPALGVDLSNYTVFNNYACSYFDNQMKPPPSFQDMRKLSRIHLNLDNSENAKHNDAENVEHLKKAEKDKQVVLKMSQKAEATQLQFETKTNTIQKVATTVFASTSYQLNYTLNPDIKLITDTFHKLQNPSDCGNAKYLIFKPGGSGFGSQIHIIATQACTAMSLGRILVPLTRLGNPEWMWNDLHFCANNPGPECYFMRLSRCDQYVRENWNNTPKSRMLALNDWSSDHQFVYSEGGPWAQDMRPRTENGVQYCRNTFGNKWKTGMVAAVSQPNIKLKLWLENGINEFLDSKVVKRSRSITAWPPHPKNDIRSH